MMDEVLVKAWKVGNRKISEAYFEQCLKQIRRVHLLFRISASRPHLRHIRGSCSCMYGISNIRPSYGHFRRKQYFSFLLLYPRHAMGKLTLFPTPIASLFPLLLSGSWLSATSSSAGYLEARSLCLWRIVPCLVLKRWE